MQNASVLQAGAEGENARQKPLIRVRIRSSPSDFIQIYDVAVGGWALPVVDHITSPCSAVAVILQVMRLNPDGPRQARGRLDPIDVISRRNIDKHHEINHDHVHGRAERKQENGKRTKRDACMGEA